MYVISLGGSLIFNHGVNVSYYSGLVTLIKELRGRYIFILGGGSLAREYIEAARKLNVKDKDALDTLGILATRMNSFLFSLALNRAGIQTYYTKNITQEPVSVLKKHEVVVAGGTKPGQTTDMVSVMCCIRLGLNSLINITEVGCICEDDPKLNPSARVIRRIKASELLKKWETKHEPGLRFPFEPQAIEKAMKHGIKVIIIGPNLNDLRDVLEGKERAGTLIIPR